jgi:hypothetical protein
MARGLKVPRWLGWGLLFAVLAVVAAFALRPMKRRGPRPSPDPPMVLDEIRIPEPPLEQCKVRHPWIDRVRAKHAHASSSRKGRPAKTVKAMPEPELEQMAEEQPEAGEPTTQEIIEEIAAPRPPAQSIAVRHEQAQRRSMDDFLLSFKAAPPQPAPEWQRAQDEVDRELEQWLQAEKR